MKKFITTVLTVALLASVSVNAGSNIFSETIGNTTITFDDSTTISYEKQEKIAYRLAAEINGTEMPYEPETKSTLCDLFGHKLQTSRLNATTHRVYTDQPRCEKIEFDMDSCTRCDYFKTTIISKQRIPCCPDN